MNHEYDYYYNKWGLIGVISNYYKDTKRTAREAHSMNARKCVHAQKPYSTQAFAHESSKVGGHEYEP